MKSQLEDSESQRMKVVGLNKNLDSQKLKLLEETESRHKHQISQLEHELDEHN